MPSHSHLAEHNGQLAHAIVCAAGRHTLIGRDVRGALPDRAGVQCRVLCVQYNQARRAYYWRMACKLPIKDYNHGQIKL